MSALASIPEEDLLNLIAGAAVHLAVLEGELKRRRHALTPAQRRLFKKFRRAGFSVAQARDEALRPVAL